MLNIFGALGHVARLLPNYVEGQRQAVQDNWRDLQQYNQVQAGQLQNMATERTMPWYFNMYADAANNSRINAYLKAMQGLTKMAGWGGEMETALLSNRWNPMLFQANAQSMLNNFNRDAEGNSLFPGLADVSQLWQQGMQPMQQQPMPGDARPLIRNTTQPTASTLQQ